MRTYPFELPLHIPSWGGFRERLIRSIVKAGLWTQLPIPLINRLAEAEEAGTGLEITQVDLDSIDDKTWDKVAAALGGR